MILKNTPARYATFAIGIALAMASCQKMDRPELKELILDPDPPAYKDLKSFWAFENNLNDQGESGLTPIGVNVSYVAGVTGQAAKIGAGGYILLKAKGDTTKYANGYKGLPADTLKNLGSYTLSFWMNVPGPVDGGAQGVFSISNGKEFWGNLDIFLENNNNALDPTEGFVKVHMFNAAVATGNGEQWNEIKIPGLLNKWSHLVVRYDATTSQISIFANGVPTGINNKVLTDHGAPYGKIKFNDFNGMVLGTYQFQTSPSLTTNHGAETWAKSLNGALDQFRIYNRPLTNAEITALYTGKN